ncbi:MAG TPA: 5'-nucleotidase C-terminal domain-containing protein [Thermomicrobiaceae bacterium]|nr:5'-nucleotidase C-terminal domain-containing protein [Thermomicrobiaceae bacterium]
MTDPRQLTIVQMNDTHAYLDLHQEWFWGNGGITYRPAGGFARIATLLGRIRAERPGAVLFADGGDTLHGTYPAVATRGEALVPILNTLAPAAMTAHWEFAYTPAVFRERVAQLSYPMLAINVYDRASGERYFPPYAVREVAGLRIGLVGIASNIVDKTMPPSYSEGVTFTDGVEELPGFIEELRGREQVDLVLLVSHLGFPQDMHLLADVRGVDVCLSSHTHNRLGHAVRQGETLVIQSGCHGSFLGRLDLEVAAGRIVDYRHRLIEVEATLPPDPEVDAQVREAAEPFADELSAVVGETATALDRSTALEATMDNLLLAALREAAGTELAFSNGWRYGAPVVPGPITRNDLYNMTPMNPPVSTVELSGAELTAMIEENLERTFARDPFHQMGGFVKRALGLRAYVRLENPAGHRLQTLFVGDDVVRPERSYRAAYVTVQGVPATYGRDRANLPVRAVQAMEDYLRRRRPVRADLVGTFVVV